MARLLPLIVLLMFPGVCSQNGWGVTYSSSPICALKGSTVTINCTYEYPPAHKITEVIWTNTSVISNGQDFPNLLNDTQYTQRIQYLGDKQHDCSVRLTDVRHTDSHEYCFRFITDKDKWIGRPGVTLDVTDTPVISISSSGVIVEGHSVTLTCSSESNPPVQMYSWFKGNTSVGYGNIYIISNIRSDHSGQYKCKTSNTCGEKYSDPVTLNVLYPPRNVSASISSSGVIVEGDSVNLTCRSESNPPANYTWFKENQTSSVGSGNIYCISNITSDRSGQYKCKAQNEHGTRNSTVTLNVMYPPRNVSASISGSSGVVEGDSVNLTCRSESNPPANYTWYKDNQTSSVRSGNIYGISNITSDRSGQYKCKAQNEHGTGNSTVTLNVMYRPRNVSASISSSGVIVEGDSVTLTCSSESNPPATISWFKENQTSSVGSGQSFRALESGWYYCVAQNKYGSQRSAAASVTVHYIYYRHLLFGITAACGGLLVIAIIIALIWFTMRKRRVAKTEEVALNQVNQQEDLYCAAKHVDLASESAHCDDVQYESVKPRRLSGEQTTAGEAAESGDPEELQYATVCYKSNTEMRGSEENENHYGNITNYKPDDSVRSEEEDTSVIYSSLK